MNFNFAPEQYKKIGEHIEKKVLKTGDRSAALWGAFLLVVSLCAFLFSPSTTELSCATGYELVVNHKMASAILFVIFHIVAILILIAPSFPDKFQFATTFTIISIPLLFFVGTNGFKSEGRACQQLPLSMVSFFTLMFNWMNCGIKAHYRQSQLTLFKSFGRLNAWIQKKYDKANEHK